MYAIVPGESGAVEDTGVFSLAVAVAAVVAVVVVAVVESSSGATTAAGAIVLVPSALASSSSVGGTAKHEHRLNLSPPMLVID